MENALRSLIEKWMIKADKLYYGICIYIKLDVY